MKTKILIATAAAAAGAVLITYLVKRMKAGNSSPKTIPVNKSHHLTEVFVHAKNHAE